MSNNIQEKLIDKKDENDNDEENDDQQHEQNGFSLDPEKLNELFDPEKIYNGKSMEKFRNLKGLGGLTKELQTNLQTGIDDNELDKDSRKKHFGNNNPIIYPPASIWELVSNQFEEPILRILCAASLVSLIIGTMNEGIEKGWIEGFAIFLAVIIIVSITAANEYIRDKQFRQLQADAEKKRTVNVLRNGKIQHIQFFDLLVGDILVVGNGDIMPVDAVVTKSDDLEVDESSLTGETNLKKKAVTKNFQSEEGNPFIISGSKIEKGAGQVLVLAVGGNTYQEQLRAKLEDAGDDETPLQTKLKILADQIGVIGIYASVSVFVAMTVHLFAEKYYYKEPLFEAANFRHMLDYVIIAVTLFVVAIPEGLPLAVTISLAYSVGKMKQEQNLVRFMQACETMGGANNICSDKTGTLTQNLMKVERFWLVGKEYTYESLNDSAFNDSQNQQLKQIIGVGICVNATANPERKPINSENVVLIADGNKTECALLQVGINLGFDFKTYREDLKNKENVLKQLPFNSERKRMSTVWKLNDKTLRIFTKGAHEIIIKKCNRYIDKQGHVKELQYVDEFREALEKQIKIYADDALRTIFFAYKDIPIKSIDVLTEAEIESDLIAIGVFAIQDPLRKEVPGAVLTCQKAGITVRMVTGDVKDTAVSIAKKANILTEDWDSEQNKDTAKFTVMTGEEFRGYVGEVKKKEKKQQKKKKDDDEDDDKEKQSQNIKKKAPQYEYYIDENQKKKFKDINKYLRVLSRSTPDDKFLLIIGLKSCDNVVAVTGDGTNDALALKEADIGFAMGIQGTEIAKAAAGIILMDDNFSSIITAIKWGRNIFDCIRKFLQFQLVVNGVAMFMVFLGGAVLKQSPLTAVQMLWVNLIMDTLGALALATEPPTDALLLRQPYKRDANMVNKEMRRTIFGHLIFQLCVLNLVLFKGPQLFDVPTGIGRDEHNWTPEIGVHFTLFFNIFVYMQVFNEINSRKLSLTEFNVFENFFNNTMFIFVILGTIVIQIALTEFGGLAVKCSPLTVEQHLTCICIGALSLVWGVVIKMVPIGFWESFDFFKQEKVKGIRVSKPLEEFLRQYSGISGNRNSGSNKIKKPSEPKQQNAKSSTKKSDSKNKNKSSSNKSKGDIELKNMQSPTKNKKLDKK